MIQDSYDIEVSNEGETYSFKSVSPERVIQKVIQFAPINKPDLVRLNVTAIYNMGFGDWDGDTKQINDLVESRNGDKTKVLATVADAALDFLYRHPTVAIYATGSTPARTRQYQMGLNQFYDELNKDYVLYGLEDGNWKEFERNVNYQAFVMYKR